MEEPEKSLYHVSILIQILHTVHMLDFTVSLNHLYGYTKSKIKVLKQG